MMYPKPKRKAKKKVDMKALYREMWDERPHICTNCGIPIPGPPVVHNFSHVRSKGARPDLKTDKQNIEIECSSVNRRDGKRGCHNLSHTNPEEYKKRHEQNTQ